MAILRTAGVNTAIVVAEAKKAIARKLNKTPKAGRAEGLWTMIPYEKGEQIVIGFLIDQDWHAAGVCSITNADTETLPILRQFEQPAPEKKN